MLIAVIQVLVTKCDPKMIHETDNCKNTALHLAAAKGNEESVDVKT